MSDKTPLLEVKGLRVAIEGKEILRGVDLTIERGEVHALMGRNGSGKSTLAYVMLGHPHYEVLEGQILYEGQDILELDTDERARLGFEHDMAAGERLAFETRQRALRDKHGAGADLADIVPADCQAHAASALSLHVSTVEHERRPALAGPICNALYVHP